MVDVGVSVEVLKPRQGRVAEEAGHGLQRQLLGRVNPGRVALQHVRPRKEHLALERQKISLIKLLLSSLTFELFPVLI